MACLFANDFDHKKGRVYRRIGKPGTETADIGSLTTKDIPGVANLAWRHFLAKTFPWRRRRRLKGDRSGTFWPFWNLMKGLVKETAPAPDCP